MFYKKIINNKKAETLIEIMISLAILSIVIVSTLKITGNSKLTLESAKNRAQAVSLAREGLEIVRYVRDYNWINYGACRRVCWNFSAENRGTSGEIDNVDLKCISSTDGSCLDSSAGGYSDYPLFGTYIPLYNISSLGYSGKFYLSNFGNTGTGSLDNIWNKKDDGQIFIDLSIFNLCENGTGGMIYSCSSPGINLSTANRSKFFRKIIIEYVDFRGNIINFIDNANKKGANHMKVTSSVIWIDGKKTQSVDLVTILSDYYGRTERDQ